MPKGFNRGTETCGGKYWDKKSFLVAKISSLEYPDSSRLSEKGLNNRIIDRSE